MTKRKGKEKFGSMLAEVWNDAFEEAWNETLEELGPELEKLSPELIPGILKEKIASKSEENKEASLCLTPFGFRMVDCENPSEGIHRMYESEEPDVSEDDGRKYFHESKGKFQFDMKFSMYLRKLYGIEVVSEGASCGIESRSDPTIERDLDVLKDLHNQDSLMALIISSYVLQAGCKFTSFNQVVSSEEGMEEFTEFVGYIAEKYGNGLEGLFVEDPRESIFCESEAEFQPSLHSNRTLACFLLAGQQGNRDYRFGSLRFTQTEVSFTRFSDGMTFSSFFPEYIYKAGTKHSCTEKEYYTVMWTRMLFPVLWSAGLWITNQKVGVLDIKKWKGLDTGLSIQQWGYHQICKELQEELNKFADL